MSEVTNEQQPDITNNEVQQHAETSAPEVNKSTETDASNEQERLFTQSDLNDAVTKRLAREKEEREALARDLAQLKAEREQMFEAFRNFGKTPEQIQQQQHVQQPEFDPSKPITWEDLTALQRQQEELERSQKIQNELENTAKEHEDFKSVVLESPLVKKMANESMAAQYYGLSKAIEKMESPSKFLYYANKFHKEEFNNLENIKDPIEQAMAIARLESKVKESAKVPSVSNAPNTIGNDIDESSHTSSNAGDIQALRKILKTR